LAYFLITVVMLLFCKSSRYKASIDSINARLCLISCIRLDLVNCVWMKLEIPLYCTEYGGPSGLSLTSLYCALHVLHTLIIDYLIVSAPIVIWGSHAKAQLAFSMRPDSSSLTSILCMYNSNVLKDSRSSSNRFYDDSIDRSRRAQAHRTCLHSPMT